MNGLDAVLHTAAQHADRVDRLAVFPEETINALRAQHLLVPAEVLRSGESLHVSLDRIAALSGVCGSSGLIWAMHLALLHTLAAHARNDPSARAALQAARDEQLLIAGATSERSQGGNIRASSCAIQPHADHIRIDKDVPVASYLQQADIVAITARRSPAAAASDQVLLLARKEQLTLTNTSPWQALGMRGTSSGAVTLHCRADTDDQLAIPFADLCDSGLVPLSHVLWAACWYGIAAGATRIARDHVRRHTAGKTSVEPTIGAADIVAARRGRLARIHRQLTLLHSLIMTECDRYLTVQQASSDHHSSLRSNELKLTASELAIDIVLSCLTTVGYAAYLEPELSPQSLSRHTRDILSAAVMVSADRLESTNAWLALRSTHPTFATPRAAATPDHHTEPAARP